MKSAALTDIRKISLFDKKKPEINHPSDVLVKIQQVGICGSDIHYFTDGKIGEQVIDFPFIIGHEAMGVIEAVGTDVSGLSAGQRIAIEPAIHCDECDQCKEGRMNTCRKNLFLGCPGQLEGALQEYLILKPQNCIPINDSISNEQAVISEPMSIGVYTVKRSNIKANEKAAIIGYGPIGQSVAKSLKANNTPAELVIEKLDYRCSIAVNDGISKTLSPSESNFQDEIDQLSLSGYHVVYECSGDQKALYDAIKILRPGGKLVIVGIPESMEIRFPIHTLRRKEIDIINIRRQVGCVEESLELMETNKIDISSMVTHHFNVEQVQEAFEIVANYQNGVMKAMINL